ncbi:MAG TPA: sigma-70 family RNA polymerase sigma factor [Acidimicrobiales bacterium]|nr:sigma-70 family RNA polymerase sigma factor [Acidimicrobiales bacterium]
MEAEAAFRALFTRAYPALVRYAHFRGLDDQDSNDLVAATLEVAWRRLAELPADDPMPWLYGVARNLRRNQLRSASRRDELFTKLPPPQPEVGAGEATPLDTAALRSALARLDEDDQEILRLVAWDGLSPSQAAVALGCTAVAARTRLHRARNRLAARLGFDPRLQRACPAVQVPNVNDGHDFNKEASDG